MGTQLGLCCIKMSAKGLNYCTYVLNFRFQLTVKDNLDNDNSANVSVTVTQDSNMAPEARAGGDFSVTLPTSVVRLDGSKSWDDLEVVRWEWTREADSLAAGKVVGNSSKEAVLMLVDLIPGRYIFSLQVRVVKTFCGTQHIH